MPHDELKKEQNNDESSFDIKNPKNNNGFNLNKKTYEDIESVIKEDKPNQDIKIIVNQDFPISKNKKNCIKKVDHKDKNISLTLQTYIAHKYIEYLLYFFSRLYNPDTIAIYLIIMLIFSILKKDYYFIFKPISFVAFGLIVTLILKKSFGRPRPKINTKRLFNVRDKENNGSMPSGDSLQAGIFAMILFYYYRLYFGFFLIPFVMTSRVYFYCHYWMDTIIGAILGIFSGFVVYSLYSKFG